MSEKVNFQGASEAQMKAPRVVDFGKAAGEELLVPDPKTKQWSWGAEIVRTRKVNGVGVLVTFHNEEQYREFLADFFPGVDPDTVPFETE